MHDHDRPVQGDGQGDGMLSIPRLLRPHARQRGGRLDGAGAQPGPGHQSAEFCGLGLQEK
jgi:hypothetical protein